MSLFSKIFGDESSRFLKDAQNIVEAVNKEESTIKAFADSDFPKKTQELKERLTNGETLESILPVAFALVREASLRTLGMRHYDVQIIGGYALHNRNIAEMKTGEGKTLVATLPVYLNALTGLGVHVVTVNDYLARRDANLMGQIYAFLGLTVSVINSQNTSYLYNPIEDEALDHERDSEGSFKIFEKYLKPCSRKDAYNADITYGTNNEFGFDYLRDNLATNVHNLVQRGHSYAVVDEVDSILIDEARTPLIISAPAQDSESLYQQFSTIADALVSGTDYEVDEKLHAITLTDGGMTKAEKMLGIENIYTEAGIKQVHHLETAVRAKALMHRDKEYVVQNGEVIIVDQSTGRLQPGRRFNEGLHQAIEAKENVTIQKETRAVASITYQNYFKMYTKLSGMTGTAKTSEEEFRSVYNLDVIEIPTHRPITRIDQVDLIFQSEQGKLKAIAEKVRTVHSKGQPILIGTISIEDNEILSAYLKQEGIPHVILNAKNHEREGQIIAGAGAKGSVVLATNMAGRGIDIKLGGVEGTVENYEEVKSLGGLFVLGTERHESRRIDNQLRGRAGRQGDPGETQFYVSLEDKLLRVFGTDRIKTMMGKFGIPEEQPIQHSFVSSSLESAQKKIEGFHFDSRKHTLEYDNVLNHQRESIYGRRRMLLKGDEALINAFVEGEAVTDEHKKILEDKKASIPKNVFIDAVKRIALHTTDVLWLEHLEMMDYLRGSVNLRAYGQREPLIEYKREGLQMFKAMQNRFREEMFGFISRLQSDVSIAPVDSSAQPSNFIASHVDPLEEEKGSLDGSSVTNLDASLLDKKYGRNDRVVVVKNGEEEEIKWKKIEEYLALGWRLKDE
jgi:preprotein translocase subunit SecA